MNAGEAAPPIAGRWTPRRVLIVYEDAGSGHRRVAGVVAEALRDVPGLTLTVEAGSVLFGMRGADFVARLWNTLIRADLIGVADAIVNFGFRLLLLPLMDAFDAPAVWRALDRLKPAVVVGGKGSAITYCTCLREGRGQPLPIALAWEPGHFGSKARQRRMEYPGALYHVPAWGDRKEAVVSAYGDGEALLRTVGEMRERTAIRFHTKERLNSAVDPHESQHREYWTFHPPTLTDAGCDRFPPSPAKCRKPQAKDPRKDHRRQVHPDRTLRRQRA